jgi:Ras-related protein Rab-8A
MAAEKFDEQVSLLLIGDSATGKTSLLLRYACDTFSTSFLTTIGIDYKTKTIDVDSRRVRLMLWDTAGQERFRSISVSYLRGAHCIILVYDCTDRGSFENVSNWLTQIEQHAQPNVACVLVGNKIDCDNIVVTKEEGDALADRYGLKHFRCSAKTNENVESAFMFVIKLHLNRKQQQTNNNNSTGRKGSGASPSLTASTGTKSQIQYQDPVKLNLGGNKDKKLSAQCCNGGGGGSSSSNGNVV